MSCQNEDQVVLLQLGFFLRIGDNILDLFDDVLIRIVHVFYLVVLQDAVLDHCQVDILVSVET